MCDFGPSETKVNNCEGNGPRLHCETRAQTTDEELWRLKTDSLGQNSFKPKLSQCDCCDSAHLQTKLVRTQHEMTQNT